jgi:2-oxoglutarate ferredoxin oxidoreductase subunit alpha
VALSAVRTARKEGIRVGLLRPITLNPFPYSEITQLINRVQAFLVVEMSAGQMLKDVEKAVGGQASLEFYGRLGGIVPFPEEILSEIRRIAVNPITPGIDPRREWLNRLKLLVN